MISFFIKMQPPTITAQEHKVTVRNGKPIFYDPPELKDAKAKLMAHLSRYAPADPIDGAIILSVRWAFYSQRKSGWKTTKPDTDNLQKMLKDCMTKIGFWKDDALVVKEEVEKVWSDCPGIGITIMTADEYEKMIESIEDII